MGYIMRDPTLDLSVAPDGVLHSVHVVGIGQKVLLAAAPCEFSVACETTRCLQRLLKTAKATEIAANSEFHAAWKRTHVE